MPDDRRIRRRRRPRSPAAKAPAAKAARAAAPRPRRRTIPRRRRHQVRPIRRPADATVPPFIGSLQSAIPGSVSHVSYYLGDWTIIVPVAHLIAVAGHLRDAPDAPSTTLRRDGDGLAAAPSADVLHALFDSAPTPRPSGQARFGTAAPAVGRRHLAGGGLAERRCRHVRPQHHGASDRRRILMPEDGRAFRAEGLPARGPGELLMENPPTG